MKKICTIVLIFVSLMSAKNSFAQDDWHIYPYTPDGSLVSFSEDGGVHDDPSVTMEWWYLNFTLIGGPPDYDLYTGMFCYFRPLELRILNIGNVATGEFYDNAIPVSGTYSLAPGHLEITYDYALLDIHDYWRWTYPEDSVTFKYTLSATYPPYGNALNLSLFSNKSPLIVGGDGWIGLGSSGDSSYYYSLSNMRVSGSIDCGFIHDTISSGIVWFDRQWGPFFVDPESDYEWFSIQVDSVGATLGEPTQFSAEFNIWQLFADSSDVPFDNTGRMVNLRFGDDFSDTSSKFIFERLGYWKDPSGERYFSHGWRFIDTVHNSCLEITPMMDDQMVTVGITRYWEGGCYCSGTIGGNCVEGAAFAELPRRTAYMIMPPAQPSELSAVSEASSIILSWRPATAGTYSIGGYRIYRATEDMFYPEYIGSTADTFFTDEIAPAGTCRYWVSAFDNQTATSASGSAGPVEATTLIVENNAKLPGNLNITVSPNPFNSSCKITISTLSVSPPYQGGDVPDLSGTEGVNIAIFDLRGNVVGATRWVAQQKGDATHRPYIWTPAPSLPSGIYIVKATSGGQVMTKRIVYLE